VIVMRSTPKDRGILFEVVEWGSKRVTWEMFVPGPFVGDEDVPDDRLAEASRLQLAAALALHPSVLGKANGERAGRQA
jgi:hypothetical protein